METFGTMSVQLVVALFLAWTIVTLVLIKGVKSIGVASYVTATLPYLVICILFVRGVTLPGAEKGIRYYLLEPDFSKLLTIKVNLK